MLQQWLWGLTGSKNLITMLGSVAAAGGSVTTMVMGAHWKQQFGNNVGVSCCCWW